MSALPPGWTRATLEELAGIGGLVTDGDWIESKDQDPAGCIRLIQLMDIGEGDFRDRSERFVTKDTAERLQCTFLREEDVLIARMPDPLGRACLFPDIGQQAITAVDVLVWRAGDEGADGRWLMHCINSPAVREEIVANAGGTTRQRISGGRLKVLSLPVPPLPEQRRIVVKLDSLFERTNAARAELSRIPLLIEHYKQAILEKAFTGELTADWRQTAGLDDPTEVDLGSVADDFAYGTSAKSARSGEIPVLRMGNIQGMALDWSDLVFTSDESEIRKYELRAGDVLFNRTNSPELVGKTALYKGERPAIFAGYLIRVRCGSGLLPEYLNYCLNSPAGRDYCWRVKSDGVSQSNINAKKLAAFRFLLPTLDEQREIVKRIEAAIDWIGNLSSEQGKAARLVYHLDQSLLAKAFKGELVPQDPADEPAAKLLERNCATCGSVPKTRRRGNGTNP